MDPGFANYLHNSREATLAGFAWNHPPAKTCQSFSLALGSLTILRDIGDLPWVSRQIVSVAGWMTTQRNISTDGGHARINATFPGHGFTVAEIANVEHFFVGATLGTLGGPGAGPVVGFWLCAVYDLVISPLAAVLAGAPVADAIRYNARQFADPDLQGVVFGSLHRIKP